ncbi:unnamed protein product [Calicophoron daubneyi]|uniref:Integrin alpha third immunoglobulin-like domain-containing protein n=1 Tax=Calicophoron daubneyi TaxID=300641 RepID=A0AAV2TSC0_CALDB
MSSLSGSSPQRITVCAPRLTRSSVSLVFVSGGCFEVDEDLTKASLYSASVSICQENPDAAQFIELRHCTMGGAVSLHPGVPEHVFIGGPYFYHAKGSALDTSDRIFAPRSDFDKHIHVAYGGPGVPVTSSVTDRTGLGLVLIYPADQTRGNLTIEPVARIEGQRFGSRFGHSLLFVDVNGDGWDDLIVGAPYQHFEALQGGLPQYGAVFVFLNQQPKFPSPVHDRSGKNPFGYESSDDYQVITPPKKRQKYSTPSLSGYGATLTKIGDINHDGYQDFAVGAPYGNTGGMVFIYHGTKSGRIGPPAQVISAADILTTTKLRGFGFAVGLQNVDLDNNGYPDLAVGAPMSDSVAILRTRPIIRFDVYLVLPDGSVDLPSNLNSLPDCTIEAQSLTGYKAATVRCLDTKLFATYSSIYGLTCDSGKKYTLSVLLKSDPVIQWLLEGLEDSRPGSHRPFQRNVEQCGAIRDPNAPIDLPTNPIHSVLAVAPVSFINEQPVEDFGEKALPFFHTNESANLEALKTPGGYVTLQVKASCRNGDRIGTEPDLAELNSAENLRLFFRDTDLIDQSKPISIGAKWNADIPNPTPSTHDINKYPIADPRKNSQILQLNFTNQCTDKVCCPRLRVTYTAKVTRDKQGPVVYVGDDKTQEIEIKVQVDNIGPDPAFMLALLSEYSPTLLEIDPTVRKVHNVRSDAAMCHLANPLMPGQTAECTIRWLVVGHQLTVQMASFFVNSSLVMASNIRTTVDGSLTNQLKVNVKMIVKVSVSSLIEPKTVYFSGNVSDGIKSIAVENQIGDARLFLKLEIRNERTHSLVPASKLVIDWPYEFVGDPAEPHGKYLLYLLDTPRVTQYLLPTLEKVTSNITSVICDSRALKKLVNPHHYRIFSSLRRPTDSVPVRSEPVDLPPGHPNSYPPLSEGLVLKPYSTSSEEPEENRNRRQTTISCYNGKVRCVPIVCELGKLSYKAGPITLELEARLWDNTMREEFSQVFLTQLEILATWRADVKYGIDMDGSDHALGKVVLEIRNNLEPRPIPPKYMSLYIGLAVFGGVLLLAVLVLILYKAGFFKRKRFFRRQPRGGRPLSQAHKQGSRGDRSISERPAAMQRLEPRPLRPGGPQLPSGIVPYSSVHTSNQHPELTNEDPDQRVSYR